MNDEIRKLLEDCHRLTLAVLRECEDEHPKLADEANDLANRISTVLEPPDAN